MHPRLALLGAAIVVSGCSWFSTVQDNLQLARGLQTGLEEAERTQPGVRFVTKPNTWFCPGDTAARKSAPCEGGVLLDLNELIDTVGGSAQGSAWRVMYLDDEQPDGDGWVAADALGTSPVLERYRSARDAFQEEFGPEFRMRPADRTEAVFLKEPEKLKGLVWLDSVRRDFVYDLSYATDGVSFWLPIRGAGRRGTEAFFYLRSDRYVQRMARHRYACTEQFCDEFSFVAILQDFKYKPTDRPHPEEGFPVLKIVRFADRFDEYRIADPAFVPRALPLSDGGASADAGSAERN